jgi:hypothetical protein
LKIVQEAWRRGNIATTLVMDIKGDFPSVARGKHVGIIEDWGLKRIVTPNIIPIEWGHTRSLVIYPIRMSSVITSLGGQSKASRTAKFSLVIVARE